MAQREIRIQEGQWESVAYLIAAFTDFERALAALHEAKATLGLGPTDRFSIDLKGKKIVVFTQENLRAREEASTDTRSP